VQADGVSGEEVPDSVPDGRQGLQAGHIHQQATDAAADVLLTP
jgi:hypothetical protein